MARLLVLRALPEQVHRVAFYAAAGGMLALVTFRVARVNEPMRWANTSCYDSLEPPFADRVQFAWLASALIVYVIITVGA